MANLKNTITLDTSDYERSIQSAVASAEEFNKGLEKLGQSKSFSKLGIDLQQFAQDLNGNSAAMSQFAQDMSKNTNTVKQQIRQLSNAMADLAANGVDQASESYRAMQMELGRLMDIQGDVQAAAKNFANDYAGIEAVTQGFQGLAGVVGMGVSAMNLFGIENENAEAAMKKTLQVTNLLNAAQSVAAVFNKDSAFMLNVIKPIREAYNQALRKGTSETTLNTTAEMINKSTTEAGTVATAAATVAETAHNTVTKSGTVFQNAWNVAKAIAKALLGDFTGLLLVGAGALITYAMNTSDATDEQKELNEAQKDGLETIKEVADLQSVLNDAELEATQSTADHAEKVEMLNKILHDNNRSLDDRKTALDKLKSIVPSYHGALTKEGELINDNVGELTNYINKLYKAAKMQAYFNQLVKAEGELMQNQMDYNNTKQELAVIDAQIASRKKMMEDENARRRQVNDMQKNDFSAGNSTDAAANRMTNALPMTTEKDYGIDKLNQQRAELLKRGNKLADNVFKANNNVNDIREKIYGAASAGDIEVKGGGHNGGNGHNGHNGKGDKSTTHTPTEAEKKEIGEYEKEIQKLQESNKKLSISQQKLSKSGQENSDKFKKQATTISDNNKKIEEYKKKIENIKKPPVLVDETSVQGVLDKLKQTVADAEKAYMTAPKEEMELKFKVYLDAQKALDDFQNELKNASTYIEVNSKAELDSTNNFDLDNLGLKELKELHVDLGLKGIEDTKEKINETLDLLNKYSAEVKRVNDLKTKGQILSGEEAEQFDELEKSVDSLNTTLEELIKKYNELVEAQNQKNESIEKLDYTKTQYQGIADTIGNVGNVISQLDGAWAQMTATMLNGISQIIPMLVAEQGAQSSLAISKGVASASGIPYPWNLVAIGTTVASIIAALATQAFAEGGIVGGTSFKGDKIYARLNSGEMVLNGRQQANLFNMINNGGMMAGGQVQFKIQGRELVGVLNNYNNKRNKVL